MRILHKIQSVLRGRNAKVDTLCERCGFPVQSANSPGVIAPIRVFVSPPARGIYHYECYREETNQPGCLSNEAMAQRIKDWGVDYVHLHKRSGASTHVGFRHSQQSIIRTEVNGSRIICHISDYGPVAPYQYDIAGKDIVLIQFVTLFASNQFFRREGTNWVEAKI